MRQYVFDHHELRKLLQLTFRHGYVHGLRDEMPQKPAKQYKRQRLADQQLEDCDRYMRMGEILDGEIPYVFVPESIDDL